MNGVNNGPTEAIDGKLLHLRGTVLSFLNLTCYIASVRSKPGISDPNYTLICEEPAPLLSMEVRAQRTVVPPGTDVTAKAPRANAHPDG